ncbi:MAG: serine protease, partial [Pseudomonadota bacterium]
RQENVRSCRAPDTGLERLHIAGGQDADLRQFPFIVQVTANGARCGGSLIQKGFVLTAAHCVMPPPGSPRCRPAGPGRCAAAAPEAVFATRPTATGRADGATRRARRVFVHPDFHYGIDGETAGSLDADVAILLLDAEFDVGPEALIDIADPFIDQGVATGGECARVAGWGLTDVLNDRLETIQSGRRTERLQALNLALVDQHRCVGRYPGLVTDNMVCAGDGIEGFNTCKGDSGGPLILDVGKPIQVGVVSWAFGCAQAEHFTVFARVGAAEVRGWINDVMAGRGE